MFKMVKQLIKLATIAMFITSNAVIAADIIQNELKVTQAYMPEVSPVSRTGAVYLTLENISTLNKVVIGASTNIAKHTMIHQTIEKDGVVKMKHVDELNIKQNDKVTLEAGGIHIMLMGLQQRPLPNPFELTLELDHGQQQTILVDIVKLKK